MQLDTERRDSLRGPQSFYSNMKGKSLILRYIKVN